MGNSFNDWYKEFLKEDKTGLSDRELLFIAFTAGQNSLPVEPEVLLPKPNPQLFTIKDVNQFLQEQREISAELFKKYCTITKQDGFAYEDDFNLYCTILASEKSIVKST